jgi:phage terminase large subunit-like protein
MRIIAFAERWGVDRVVAEVNNGGDYVEATLRAAGYTGGYEAVRATRGKQTRAEPIAMAYEQGRGVHVGEFAELERQLTNWVPGESDSPDRLDALVWLFTYLGVTYAGSWATLYKPGPEPDGVFAGDEERPRRGWGTVYAVSGNKEARSR